MFYSVCNHIRHNGITETMFILIHNYWFAAMMQQVIFKVTAKIRGWKIYFNPFFRIVLLNKFQRRYEVAIGTHKDYRVCCIKNAICHHTDRDINICFLFFWSGDGILTIWTNYLFFKIFTTYNLETVTVYQFVGILCRMSLVVP